ncbi:MAG: ATP-binding cassette domain-containing protein [Nitrospirota bacterium]|nr:ATP-binding cassette domain-containing protein [Nitrospirota bacterium]
MISVTNLVKVYRSKAGDRTAVNDISFHVGTGEFFSFLGPNGAGKTTTIGMMVALLAPSSGKILIDGLDVVESPHQVRQRIGIIFQDPSLDDRLSAWENLEFHGRLYGISGPIRKKRGEFLLDIMGLTERKNDLVRTFSGGMKRRLEIVRGLIHAPKVLILDEPTLGLDPHSRRIVWEYIHSVRKEVGMTVFLTTHYLEEADGSDRVGIINKGKIVALDTPGQLKKSVGPEVLNVRVQDRDSMKKYIIDTIPEIRDSIREEPDGSLSFSMGSHLASPWEFLKYLPFPIIEASIRRPNLDDVFIQYTGNNLSDNPGNKIAGDGA